jgi:leucyl-tRNA synthetase/predicted alpha/beta hydrolase family esterase
MSTYQNFLNKKGEQKWQKYWEENKLFKTKDSAGVENKFYILPQLPYPSGSGLHVGHAEVYTACDIFARFQRMNEKKVLQVIGWDSFGLPAENYAIKTNIHPRKSTDKAIDTFRKQIKLLGISVDWDREVGSHNPDYYKWTQWLFLLMYKRGLAYRKKQYVNWCDGCKTVLSNEQVKDGKCERCETIVMQKEMEQWFLKITDYAEKLLQGLEKLDWPEESIKRQKDWIGKSDGASAVFKIKDSNLTIEVFTTRPDTLFGVTYMVLAPEHKLLSDLKNKISNWKDIEQYIEQSSHKTELQRQVNQEKTGVEIKGIKAVNPANNEEIPVFVADYVLSSYGTGAIMAVPAHDERDWEFANKYCLKIKKVVDETEYIVKVDKKLIDFEKLKIYQRIIFVNEVSFNDGEFALIVRNKRILQKIIENCIQVKNGRDIEILKSEIKNKSEHWYKTDQEFIPDVFSGDGTAINSEFLNDLPTSEAKEKMIKWLEKNNVGKRKVQYKLRDWSVSRQRFWGAPIPMLFSKVRKEKKRQFVFAHGFKGSGASNYFPALKKFLESMGHTVISPDLPKTTKPSLKEQAEYILKTTKIDEDTVLLGHSLGGPVVLTLLQETKQKVAKVIFSDSFYIPEFVDKKRPDVEQSSDWKFDLDLIKTLADEFVLVVDDKYPIIPKAHSAEFAKKINARIVYTCANARHFDSAEEPIFYSEVPVSGLLPILENDLPVILPDDVDFKPTGESPLNYSKDFQKGVAKKYGKGWEREPDTLDTFMCSSWYYFRYIDPRNEHEFASSENLKKWMPVDFYLGGPEHVNGHLLYSRFITKVLHDAGYVNFDEPFPFHRHQGLILGEDNRKMSKRWGNVINPTDIVSQFSADTLRIYEMFMGPLEDSKPWDTNGVRGVRRFLDKVWNLQEKISNVVPDSGLEKLLHKTIKKIGEDIACLHFNTAVAKLMELVNGFAKADKISKEQFDKFILILSPFAPHICEELWSLSGHKNSLNFEKWPVYDKTKIVEENIVLAVQVNGKVRGTIEVPVDIEEKGAAELALNHENVKKWLDGKPPQKVIYIKGRLVSIVV